MTSELKLATQNILEKFESTWTFDGRDLNRPSVEQTLRELIEKQPSHQHGRLNSEFFETGPLQNFIKDEDIQEIIINGEEDIWIERNGSWEKSSDAFLSAQTYKNFLDRMCSQAQLKLDLEHPFVDGRWGPFRVHLGMAPLTHCSFHLTLRRLAHSPWTMNRLEDLGWANSDDLQKLRSLIDARKNLMFIGPTGCGKTSVLNACLQSLCPSERVVILEDTDELVRPNSASTKMLTRNQKAKELEAIGLSDLIRQSLRMRPQRLVVGEVRGPEAKDLLMAMSTGHSGSMGTLHAANAREALIRLEMLIQLGAPQWSLDAIRQLIRLSIDAIVVCTQTAGKRRLASIERITGLESFGFLLESL